MKRIYTGILCLLCMGHCFSQQDQQAPSTYEVQLIPENPDVADLGKFGTIPVNKYNGTANVTVPIHTIDLDGLSIPIALRYNTSGIRVNQDAAWVGLGWNLSEGMTITREINGFEDIRSLAIDTEGDSFGWIYSKDYYKPGVAPNYAPELDIQELREIESAHVSNNPIDTEPDLFTLSIPAGSVKFYLPKIKNNESTLNAVVIDEKNYKISYDITNKNFVVVDPSGFTYQFNIKEYSTGYSSWDASPSNIDPVRALQGIPSWSTNQTRKMISSWKVSELTSPYGNSLGFEYTEGFFFSYPSYTESQELYNTDETEVDLVDMATYGTPLLSVSLNAFHMAYLTEITGDFGAVRFSLSGREDLFSKEDKRRMANDNWEPAITPNVYNAKKLDRIEVVDLYNKKVKTATFHYNYFNNHKLNDVDKVSYLRLKLDSVRVQDQRYTFAYNNPNGLAKKDTKATDFWGFYNGQNNEVRIPRGNRFFLRAIPTSDHFTYEQFIKWDGANRKSDVNYGKYGVLERVTYPTGGYSQFEYEGHRTTLKIPSYEPFVTDESNRMLFTNLQNSTDYNFRYQYLKMANDPNYSFYDNNTCSIGVENHSNNETFTVAQTSFCNSQSYNVRIQATLNCSVGCGASTYPSGRAVWLENVDTGQEITIFSYDNRFNVNTSSVSLTINRNLPIGNYVLRQQNWTRQSPLAVATVNATISVWKEQSVFVPGYEEFEVGGTRIASITNYDSDGSFLSAKRYTYTKTKADNSVSSSGILMDDLVFASKGYGHYEYTPENFSTERVSLHSVNRLRTSPTAAGSHIGYSEVTEKNVDAYGVDIGKIHCRYQNEKNENITRNIGVAYVLTGILSGAPIGNPNPSEGDLIHYDYYEVAYGETYMLNILPKTKEHSNGQMLEQNIYQASGELLERTINTYTELKTGRKVALYYPVMVFIGLRYPFSFPNKKMDGTSLERDKLSRLIRSETTQFYENKAITNITDYTFGSPYHYMPTQISTTDSEGDINTVVSTYPQDMEDDLQIEKLVDKNRTTNVIKRENYKGNPLVPLNSKIRTERTFYDDSLSPNALVLPSKIITTKGASALEYQRVRYEKYDQRGKLLQYRQQESGLRTTLLWAHNGQYPIAKIENTSFQEVATALGVTENTLMNLSTQNLHLLSNLRTALPQSMVYTYVVKPLVGIIKVTDPKGYFMQYEYDAYNRLTFIKDAVGNLVSENKYNYKK